MNRIFSWLCAVLTPLAFFAAGCAGPAQPSPKMAAAAEARAALPARVAEARTRAWQTALDITEVYERIPADRCPGIAALVRDIREAERRVGKSGARNLDRLDPDRLTLSNPNFWRASLEIAPTDGSILLLQATLLASGGELWRANRILTAVTQLLPLPAAVRPYYLTHTYTLGSVVVLSVRATEAESLDRSPRAAVSRLEREWQLWPRNAVVMSALIDARIRARAAAGGGLDRLSREQLAAAVEQGLSDARPEIESLRRVDPLMAAGYRGGAEDRRRGRKVRDQWSRLADSDAVLSHKEIGEVAAALEGVDIPELALVLARIQVVARGFPAPGDAQVWKRLLPKLIGPAAADGLLGQVERGELNVVELNQGTLPGVQDWKGDPAIHPLLMQQVQREIADLTFQVDILRDMPAARAQALRNRGIQYSRAGLYEAALADFDEAMKLAGRQPLLLLDQAVVHGTNGNIVEAEKLLAEAEAVGLEKPRILRERGILSFGQGRYGEAQYAFGLNVQSDPRDPYAVILAELAARRMGRSDRGLLDRARKNAAQGSWPDLCLAFLSRQASEEALLREASVGDTLEVAQKLCEAYFILGQTALASGDRQRGLDYLQSCIETGVTGFVEFRLARAELRRVNPEREARTRRWEAAPEPEPSAPGAPNQERSVEEELLGDPVPA